MEADSKVNDAKQNEEKYDAPAPAPAAAAVAATAPQDRSAISVRRILSIFPLPYLIPSHKKFR